MNDKSNYNFSQQASAQGDVNQIQAVGGMISESRDGTAQITEALILLAQLQKEVSGSLSGSAKTEAMRQVDEIKIEITDSSRRQNKLSDLLKSLRETLQLLPIASQLIEKLKDLFPVTPA